MVWSWWEKKVGTHLNKQCVWTNIKVSHLAAFRKSTKTHTHTCFESINLGISGSQVASATNKLHDSKWATNHLWTSRGKSVGLCLFNLYVPFPKCLQSWLPIKSRGKRLGCWTEIQCLELPQRSSKKTPSKFGKQNNPWWKRWILDMN